MCVSIDVCLHQSAATLFHTLFRTLFRSNVAIPIRRDSLSAQPDSGYSKRSLPTRHVSSSCSAHTPASSRSSRPANLRMCAAPLGVLVAVQGVN